MELLCGGMILDSKALKKRHLFLAIILGILFPIVLLISAIEVASFDKVFFMSQIEANEVVKNTGIHEDDMEMVVDEIYSFLRGTRETFDIQARLHTESPVSIFNEQDIVHMEDVRDLLNSALIVRNIGGLICLLSFVSLLKWDTRLILKGLLWGSLGFIGIVGLIGIGFVLDFDGAFTLFHELVFSNDLWIMDPKTDVLIWIVPTPFFFNLIIRILAYTMIPLLITGLTSGLVLKFKTKN